MDNISLTQTNPGKKGSQKTTFHEMSIRIGGYLNEQRLEEMDMEERNSLSTSSLLTSTPLKLIHECPVTIQRVKECVFQAILDGFTHVVYDFVRSGDTQLSDLDNCTFRGFDLEKVWTEMSTKESQLSSISMPKFK